MVRPSEALLVVSDVEAIISALALHLSFFEFPEIDILAGTQ